MLRVQREAAVGHPPLALLRMLVLPLLPQIVTLPVRLLPLLVP